MGGGRYSDNRYSDISKWVMQWVRVRVRVRAMDRVMVRVKVTVRVRVSVSCTFSEAFVGIGAVGIAVVGIAACTRCNAGPFQLVAGTKHLKLMLI